MTENNAAQARAAYLATAIRAAHEVLETARQQGYDGSVTPDEDYPEGIVWLGVRRVDHLNDGTPRGREVVITGLLEYTAPSDGSGWSIDTAEHSRAEEGMREEKSYCTPEEWGPALGLTLPI